MGGLRREQGWLAEGTAGFTAEVARLSDVELVAGSALSGWTRAHVVAHVARNADALVNLLTWARTGVETPMYSGPNQRAHDIEISAKQPPGRLVDDLQASNDRLARVVAELPIKDWATQVRTAQGRWVPASEVLWLRVREVWIHVVDLGGDASFAAFPPDLVDALLTDIAGTFTRRGGLDRSVRLVPTDRQRDWMIGAFRPAGVPAVEVSGTAAALLEWMSGRADGAALGPAETLPELGDWL